MLLDFSVKFRIYDKFLNIRLQFLGFRLRIWGLKKKRGKTWEASSCVLKKKKANVWNSEMIQMQMDKTNNSNKNDRSKLGSLVSCYSSCCCLFILTIHVSY